MIEYHINVNADRKFVKTLYQYFLKNDPRWHFALEGSYIEIRTSGDNEAMERFLTKKGISWEKHEYINNTEITRKYQACFDDIYHGYAMLAVTLPPKKMRQDVKRQDFYRVLERCLHLACNNFCFDSERKVLWQILGDRTFMAGYCYGAGLIK